jgi:hypothetical protein
VETHALLQQGVQRFLQAHPDLASAAVQAAAAKLDLDW